MAQNKTDQAETPTTEAPQETTGPRSLSSLIGKRNPDNEAILDEIAGTPVSIIKATTEQRQGRRRKYWVSHVTLEDGRSFDVVGKAVADPLNYLQPEDFPVLVTFTQEPSDFEPGAYYWSVS